MKIICTVIFIVAAISSYGASICGTTNDARLDGLWLPDYSLNGFSNQFVNCVFTNDGTLKAVNIQGDGVSATTATNYMIIDNTSTNMETLAVNRTIAAWLYVRNPNANQFPLCISDGAGNINQSIEVVTTNVYLWLRDKSGANSIYSLIGVQYSTWTHFAATWDSTAKVVNTYKNGVLLSSGATWGSVTNLSVVTTGTFTMCTIGAQRNTTQLKAGFNGSVRDLIIYPAVINVTNLYTQTDYATRDDGWHTNYSALANLIYRADCSEEAPPQPEQDNKEALYLLEMMIQ